MLGSDEIFCRRPHICQHRCRNLDNAEHRRTRQSTQFALGKSLKVQQRYLVRCIHLERAACRRRDWSDAKRKECALAMQSRQCRPWTGPRYSACNALFDPCSSLIDLHHKAKQPYVMILNQRAELNQQEFCGYTSKRQ